MSKKLMDSSNPTEYTMGLEVAIRGKLSEIYIRVISDAGAFYDEKKAAEMLKNLKRESVKIFDLLSAEWELQIHE